MRNITKVANDDVAWFRKHGKRIRIREPIHEDERFDVPPRWKNWVVVGIEPGERPVYYYPLALPDQAKPKQDEDSLVTILMCIVRNKIMPFHVFEPTIFDNHPAINFHEPEGCA